MNLHSLQVGLFLFTPLIEFFLLHLLFDVLNIALKNTNRYLVVFETNFICMCMCCHGYTILMQTMYSTTLKAAAHTPVHTSL